MLKNKRILVTGGTGSFGQKFVEYGLAAGARMVVLSRDEMKQWEMRKRLPGADYYLGDVRDVQRLERAFEGVDIVIHAAALKVVPTAEFDPLEYTKTNVQGTANVIEACLDRRVSAAVLLSTDKACKPINLYGSTKLVAEKLFLAANTYNKDGVPAFSVVRYGNVMGSRGSVIPLFMEQRKTGVLTITDVRMTRFMIDLDQAVDLVVGAIGTRKIHIPRLPAMKVLDIAGVIAPEAKLEIIGIRHGEKIHEELEDGYSSENPERWYESWELKEWILSNYGQLQSPMPDFSTPS